MTNSGRVTGRILVRPVRLGLVIDRESSGSVSAAIAAASACWGGKTFPIFFADQQESVVRRTAVHLGIDAIVPMDDVAATSHLADLIGFTWRGKDNPLRDPQFGYGLASVAAVLSAMRSSRESIERYAEVTWDSSESLDPIREVLFGHMPRSEGDGDLISRFVANTLRSVHLSIEQVARIDDPVGGLLDVGMWQVRHLSRGRPESGVALVDPSSPTDLVRWWNLRAVGHNVLPWPTFPCAPVESVTSELIRFLPANRWGKDTEEYINLYARTEDDVPDALSELVTRLDRTAIVHRASSQRGDAEVHGGIATKFSRVFESGIVDRDGRPTISIQLPPTGLHEPPGIHGAFRCIATRITVDGEEGLPAGFSFAVPAVRQLNDELRSSVSFSSAVIRGVGDGIVATTALYDDDHPVRISASHSRSLIFRLLTDAGFGVSPSEAGPWTNRIIELLGGPTSTVSSQPAFREVLDRAARSSGAKPAELRQIARNLGGKWAERSNLYQPNVKYEDGVLGFLTSRKLIEANLTYDCRACGLKQSIAPDEISSTVTCNDCDNESPVSLHVVQRASWTLKTRRLLTPDRLRATFPIASTLTLLAVLRRNSGSNLHYAIGVDLEAGGERFEIDLAALVHDEFGTALVLAEAKARGDVDSTEIDNLERVQDAVRATGLECYIAVVNSKSRLSALEIARLRQSADRLLVGLSEVNNRWYLNLPLVLTKRELTLHDLDEDHPTRQIGFEESTIAALAYATAKKHLGLLNDAGPGHSVMWTDPDSGE